MARSVTPSLAPQVERCKKQNKFAVSDDLLRTLRDSVTRRHVEQMTEILRKAAKPGPGIKGIWTYAQEQFPKFADACRVQGTVEWSEDEVAALQKALRKYPGGTRRRWLLVSQMVSSIVNRPISEDACAAKVKSMRTKTQQQVSKEVRRRSQTPSIEPWLFTRTPRPRASQIVDRVKTNAGAASAPAPASPRPDPAAWSVEQQKALEDALRTYPASMDKNERWTKIAAAVPDKTKKDCVKRFKELREQMMKK